MMELFVISGYVFAALAYLVAGTLFVCMLLSEFKPSTKSFRRAIALLAGAGLSKFLVGVAAYQRFTDLQLWQYAFVRDALLLDIFLAAGLAGVAWLMRLKQLERAQQPTFQCLRRRIRGKEVVL